VEQRGFRTLLRETKKKPEINNRLRWGHGGCLATPSKGIGEGGREFFLEKCEGGVPAPFKSIVAGPHQKRRKKKENLSFLQVFEETKGHATANHPAR